ncbi:MAG: glutamine-hydrolyzing carbamoyl-phosphate synthase small subunit [bacterium]
MRTRSPDAGRHRPVRLELEDGTTFDGVGFGFDGPAAGEVVFNTSMVGYVEALTDPSYRGQILVMTYPLVGNYGVPAGPERWESGRIQAAGFVVQHAHHDTSHAGAALALGDWLAAEGVPGITGIDTRRLTLRLRERGTMLGRIVPAGGEAPAFFDPNATDIVGQVSTREAVRHGAGGKRVILVDCGVKSSILRELAARGVEVLQVPFDWDYTGTTFDGILLSNGPGNPERCGATVGILRRALALGRPVFGICLGAQLLALAAGGRTYKLRYGHRGQNQPCRESGGERCRLTSQNHGFAIDPDSLPGDWQVWFTNANDGSVEGIRHRRRPFRAVQFHPEAAPGPLDSRDLFDSFVEAL